MAFGAADSGCEYSRLIPDGVVVEWEPLAQPIFGPLRQRSLNVRELALRPFDGRPASLLWKKILLFVPQDF